MPSSAAASSECGKSGLFSKPYIGRGFSENLPVETAKKIREKQGKKMKYDVEKTCDELQKIMNELDIKKYRIYIPRPAGSEGVNYGIWLEFQKF